MPVPTPVRAGPLPNLQYLEEKNVDDVCLFQFAFNPRSFSQTIENVFYLSFLVRARSCFLPMNPDPHGMVDLPVRSRMGNAL